MHANGNSGGHTREWITMLLENFPYPQDPRVRPEAESLVKAGHHVTVIAPRDDGQKRRETIDGVDVIRYRRVDGGGHGAPGFVLEYLGAAIMLHASAVRTLFRGATVLHIHNPPDILFPAAILFRLAGRKVIFDHHDLFPEMVAARFGPGWVSRLAARCQRLTLDVAHHVIATNASYAAVALTRKSLRQVTIVRNAPPSDWTRLPLRLREGVLEHVELAYVGKIASQDGVAGLAPVLASLCNGTRPIDARLTIIGDGDDRAAVERRLAEHDVADRVTFTGWVTPSRVVELLREADICLDPSPPIDVNERSTMIKIAEYMALGKPIVGYDLLESRCTAADAALLVERGNAEAFAAGIRRLACEPSLRHRLAHEARARAQRLLTWDHSERALLQAYAALRGETEPSRATGPGAAVLPARSAARR